MLEELHSHPKLEPRGGFVPPARPDGDAVVQLQPGDAAQFQSHTQSVAQSEVLRHSVEVAA